MALVPCLTKHILRENQDYVPGEREYRLLLLLFLPSLFFLFLFLIVIFCIRIAQSWGTGEALWTEVELVSFSSQRSLSQVPSLPGELTGLGFPRGGGTM